MYKEFQILETGVRFDQIQVFDGLKITFGHYTVLQNSKITPLRHDK